MARPLLLVMMAGEPAVTSVASRRLHEMFATSSTKLPSSMAADTSAVRLVMKQALIIVRPLVPASHNPNGDPPSREG